MTISAWSRLKPLPASWVVVYLYVLQLDWRLKYITTLSMSLGLVHVAIATLMHGTILNCYFIPGNLFL